MHASPHTHNDFRGIFPQVSDSAVPSAAIRREYARICLPLRCQDHHPGNDLHHGEVHYEVLYLLLPQAFCRDGQAAGFKFTGLQRKGCRPSRPQKHAVTAKGSPRASLQGQPDQQPDHQADTTADPDQSGGDHHAVSSTRAHITGSPCFVAGLSFPGATIMQ